MPDANLVDNIVQGRLPEEDERDLLFMTVAMALAVVGADPDQAVTSEAWNGLLDRAGRILCPLFDYAKPETYREAMENVRRSYAGIAGDRDLQLDYWLKLVSLAGAGDLADLEAAVEAGIGPRLLATRRVATLA